MKTIFTRKHIGTAVMCAMAVGAATAQPNPENNAFVLDQRSGVVKSGFGLCWHSGTGPAPASTAECGSTYVVPPMAKSEAAPTPVTQRVTLDADTLFDFNKADLRPAGRDALDDFVGKTKNITPEVITAVGHADRFGSESYNMQLSAQRAAAVKTYLLSKGIASNRISTEGRGETQPVTKAGDCRGAQSKAVIECLQGDRRVDIEVVGSTIVR